MSFRVKTPCIVIARSTDVLVGATRQSPVRLLRFARNDRIDGGLSENDSSWLCAQCLEHYACRVFFTLRVSTFTLLLFVCDHTATVQRTVRNRLAVPWTVAVKPVLLVSLRCTGRCPQGCPQGFRSQQRRSSALRQLRYCPSGSQRWPVLFRRRPRRSRCLQRQPRLPKQ